MTMTELPKCLRKYADKIESVSDERPNDGYWVYLAAGWWSPMDETHCIHEDAPTECAKVMKYIEPCTVPGCCSPKVG